jgi:hypothetical protein
MQVADESVLCAGIVTFRKSKVNEDGYMLGRNHDICRPASEAMSTRFTVISLYSLDVVMHDPSPMDEVNSGKQRMQPGFSPGLRHFNRYQLR